MISSSGFGPGSSLRKILRIARSPKTTEVLLCSALMRFTWCGDSGRISGRAAVAREQKRPRRPAMPLPVRMCASSAMQNAGSSMASATVQPAGGGPASAMSGTL